MARKKKMAVKARLLKYQKVEGEESCGCVQTITCIPSIL